MNCTHSMAIRADPSAHFYVLEFWNKSNFLLVTCRVAGDVYGIAGYYRRIQSEKCFPYQFVIFDDYLAEELMEIINKCWRSDNLVYLDRG